MLIYVQNLLITLLKMDKQLDPVKDKLDECGATTEEHIGINSSLEPYGPSGKLTFPPVF